MFHLGSYVFLIQQKLLYVARGLYENSSSKVGSGTWKGKWVPLPSHAIKQDPHLLRASRFLESEKLMVIGPALSLVTGLRVRAFGPGVLDRFVVASICTYPLACNSNNSADRSLLSKNAWYRVFRCSLRCN